MNYLIDYFCVSVRLDTKQEATGELNLGKFLDIVGLYDEFINFVCIGSHLFYDKVYKYGQIEVFSSEYDSEKIEKQGFMLQLTGQGCREYEALFNNFSWKTFVTHLIELVPQGYCVNFPRVDFAFDDKGNKKDALLDIPTIWDAAVSRDYVSLYRSAPTRIECDSKELNLPKCENHSLGVSAYKYQEGGTINFGNRKSNCYCKFYDKKIEQMIKHKKNLERLKELEKIEHWVRFEITFKRDVANKIFLSMITQSDDDFISYLAGVINTYIRFINRDDTNVSRCSLKSWWADFIGTASTSKLTHKPLKSNPLARSLAWVNYSLSGTLKALIDNNNIGLYGLYAMICDSADSKKNSFRNKKYQEIRNSDIILVDNNSYTAIDYWKSLVPKSIYDVIIEDVKNIFDVNEWVEILPYEGE